MLMRMMKMCVQCDTAAADSDAAAGVMLLLMSAAA
jgi:hypothetical protein